VGITAMMVAQVVVAVLANWVIWWVSSQTSINSLVDSLETDLALSTQSTVIRYLQNASVATSLSTDMFNFGIITLENRELLRRGMFAMVTEYPLISNIIIGFPDGTGIAYGRDTLGGPIILDMHPTPPPPDLLGERFSVDNFGDPVALIGVGIFNVTARPWFLEAQMAGTQIWSTISLIPVLNLFGITAASPIFQNGTLVAVVGTELNLVFISAFLAQQTFGKSGTAFIVDRTGLLVASSVSEIVYFLPDGTKIRRPAVFCDPIQFCETANQLLKRFGSFQNVPETRFTFRSSIGRLLVTVEPVFDPGGIDWLLVVMVPRSDWYATIDRANFIALGLTAFCLVVAIFLAILCATWISRPLKRMSKAMEKIITDVELVHGRKQPSSRLKEIASLQKSFAGLQHALVGFLKYVPVEVVRLLVKFNAEPVIGAENRNVTLFFSDIADFTSLAERVSPCSLVNHLSLYLGKVTDIILESQGTLADYIGDAVFAFWNAPLEVPNHASVACESALLQIECLNELNTQWAAINLPVLHVRIGIHTGNALCGNMGSRKRMKYSAIGDSVNLASRLENLNKRYQTTILVTEDVYLQVRHDYLCRALDVVAVKGRKTATWIFELLGRMKDATPEQKRISLLSSNALTHYLMRDFQSCLRTIHDIENLWPGDKALVPLKERALQLSTSPPSESWTGVEILSTK
jgi:adenylate cyclase